jgi:hypothetical protein
MGTIPAKTAMVSVVITNPAVGQTIPAGQTFNITVQTSNLQAGAFTNADTTYYAAPQALKSGQVVGHTHVTVQDMGKSLNPATALDPTQFAFFKGINDAGNGKGLLAATVTNGLPAGNYRVCTITSAANHQPVLMPVAQRGTADDCTKFVVSGNGGSTNAAANDGSGGIAAAALAASAVQDGPGAITTAAAAAGGKATATKAAAAATSSTAAKAAGGKGNTATAATGKTGAAAAGGNAGAKASTGATAGAKTGGQVRRR